MLAADYPYLLGGLLMLLAFALGAVLSSGQRRPILTSAVLSAPYACSSVFFVPEYWEPRRTASFVAGPEDTLFSLAGGGLGSTD